MAYFEFRVGGAAGSSELTSGDGRGAVPRALLRALISLFHPKIFSLMLWPPLLALILWLGLSFAFWGQMAAWISQEFQTMDSVNWLFGWWPFSLLASSIGWVVLVLMFVPIVLISASIIIALVGMPIMLSHVAARDYPQLQRAQGVRHALHALVGGWLNVLLALGGLFVLGVLSAPLWLVPLLWPVLPVLLLAWFDQRLLGFEALAEHADATERRAIRRQHWRSLMLLGVILAIIGFIPLLGLFSPVYGALAFIHFCLDALARQRSDPLDNVSYREVDETELVGSEPNNPEQQRLEERP